MEKRIEIYDTTLRDGTQAENFNLSVEDKIRIALRLDEFGVDFIEGGWPGANPASTEFFRDMRNYRLNTSRLMAFGSTRLFRNPPEEDANLAALVDSGSDGITIFGKSWDIHVTEALGIGLEDNLAIIADSLAFLRPRVDFLFYDAEHFFDGYKANPDYALETLARAVEGGADRLILCDTNGGTLPHEIRGIIKAVQEFFSARGEEPALGIHAHNDSGVAVANSLIAVDQGAVQVQGTINGYGERCGNANLTTIIPCLALKMGCELTAAANLEQLTGVSRFVSELANLTPDRYQPFVGDAAFAHKGGIHVSAVRKNPLTYEHIVPERVGNQRRILISDQAGRSNILHKAKKFGIELEPGDPVVSAILAEVKNMENQGYQFEGAEASFELLMRRAIGGHRRYFDLHGFRVISQKDENANPSLDEATIRIDVGGETVHTAALGDGPVNALDNALRKALLGSYPALAEMHLEDYKVRVLASDHGTGARVRVLIQSSDNGSTWSTVGVSHDIIEASWLALVDSITYKLMKDDGLVGQ